jgi:hypothetical protein
MYCTIYTRGPPFKYSVKAKATKPNMANLPFNISALSFMIPLVFDCTFSPLNKGTNEATEKSTAVPINQGTPPFDNCTNKSSPLAASTAIAAIKPSMASRPLILSGAGPLNASTSENLVLT